MVCTVSCLWFCSQAHFPVLPAATTTGGVGSHIRAMSAAGRIDVLQNDRGLKTCFEAANILPTWSDTFCKLHKVETLDDYVYLMDTKEWEQNLKDLLNASIDLKDNRIILSRFKAAYESGISAIKTSQSSQKVEDSLDAVLPETTLQSVTKDFARRYGVVLDPTLIRVTPWEAGSIRNSGARQWLSWRPAGWSRWCMLRCPRLRKTSSSRTHCNCDHYSHWVLPGAPHTVQRLGLGWQLWGLWLWRHQTSVH